MKNFQPGDKLKHQLVRVKTEEETYWNERWTKINNIAGNKIIADKKCIHVSGPAGAGDEWAHWYNIDEIPSWNIETKFFEIVGETPKRKRQKTLWDIL